MAYGATPEKAVREVRSAAFAMLKVMAKDGKPAPAVDTTLSRVMALQPILNLSAIAKASRMSVQTFSSKITRGSTLTKTQAARIGRVLAAHGVAS